MGWAYVALDCGILCDVAPRTESLLTTGTNSTTTLPAADTSSLILSFFALPYKQNRGLRTRNVVSAAFPEPRAQARTLKITQKWWHQVPEAIVYDGDVRIVLCGCRVSLRPRFAMMA